MGEQYCGIPCLVTMQECAESESCMGEGERGWSLLKGSGPISIRFTPTFNILRQNCLMPLSCQNEACYRFQRMLGTIV
jgi:hypothetical protein